MDPGPDGFVFRKANLTLEIDTLSDILTAIFQYSIDIVELPSQWKLANVVPIFKAGKRTSPSNYRPVSLTCIPCKLVEHIALHELNKLLDGKISSNQRGFRRGLPCTTQLVGLLHEISREVERGK